MFDTLARTLGRKARELVWSHSRHSAFKSRSELAVTARPIFFKSSGGAGFRPLALPRPRARRNLSRAMPASRGLRPLPTSPPLRPLSPCGLVPGFVPGPKPTRTKETNT